MADGTTNQAPNNNGERTNPPINPRVNNNSTAKQSSPLLVKLALYLSVVGSLVTLFRSSSVDLGANLSHAEHLSALAPTGNRSRARWRKNSAKKKPVHTEEGQQRIKTSKIKRAKKNSKSRDIDPIKKEKRQKFMEMRKGMPQIQMSHFLSHIPKTGAEYAAKMLLHLMLSTIPLPQNKSIWDIQTAQHRYNASLDLTNATQQLYFHHNSMDHHENENPNSDAYAPPWVCNTAKTPLNAMPPYDFGGYLRDIKLRCVFWMSEQSYTERADNIYTIIRDPVSQLVSQYFHCREARNRVGTGRGELMPDQLDPWINDFVRLAEEIPMYDRPPYFGEWNQWKKFKSARTLKKKYKCYNPIDSQSDFVKFPPLLPNSSDASQKSDGSGSRLKLPAGYTYPYPPTNLPNTAKRDKATLDIDRQLFDDLKARYQVIGDMAQMTRTVCAIFIDFTKGKHIPRPCDCTHVNITNDSNSTLPSTFHVPNLYVTPEQNQKIIDGASRRRALFHRSVTLGYNRTKDSHGVKHHGSAFAKKNLSNAQRQTILEKLRSLDNILYNVSRHVFDAQVAELEDRYKITICDKDWNRETEVSFESEESEED